MRRYVRVAETIIEEALGLRRDDVVLVVTDPVSRPFGDAFAQAFANRGHPATLMVMPETRTDGADPPSVVGGAMRRASLVVAVTARTLTHGLATLEARREGARILSMPNLNDRLFLSPAIFGGAEMAARTVRAAELLNFAEQALVKTAKGTELHVPLGGWRRPAGADTGEVTEPGVAGNLPAGEALTAPIEGQAEGSLVIDASLSGGIGLLTGDVVLTVKRGRVVGVEGGPQADALARILEERDENATNLAELAIGLNPKAEIIGNMLLDEKLEGTAHVGIGNGQCIGGTVYSNVHLDALFKKPTIYLDGEALVEEGWLCLGPKRFEDHATYTPDPLPGPITLRPGAAVTAEDDHLRLAWTDAMGRTHLTRVGTGVSSRLAVRVYRALQAGPAASSDLAPASGLERDRLARVLRMLAKYGVAEPAGPDRRCGEV